MTDPRIDIWNLLHDGEITVAARDADALVLFVSIPYLRSSFRPIGDSFALRLSGSDLLGWKGRTVASQISI